MEYTLVLWPITSQLLLQLVGIASEVFTLTTIIMLFAAPFPPTDVMAIQSSPTNITVTRTPPSPLGDTTSYTISYTGGSRRGSVTISGSSTSSFILSELRIEEMYAILIVSMSSVGLPSEPVQTPTIGLGMSLLWHNYTLQAPVLHTSPRTYSTSITITGSVSRGSVVTGFVVHWRRNVSIGSSDVDQRPIRKRGRFSLYTITGVEPGNILESR